MHRDQEVTPVPHAATSPPPLPVCRSPRLDATIVALIGLGAFVAAASLWPYEPDGRPGRFGTHRQLGLPSCLFQSLFDVPCPSCGMTTSLALLMHGDPGAAWRVNWAAVILATMAAPAVAWLLVIAVTGIEPGRLSVGRTVEWLAMGGVSVAILRYVGLGVGWLFNGAS